MTTPVIRSTNFKDISDLPQVHTDARRTIYERITRNPDGSIERITRSVVNAEEAVLGNHYHDFDQHFSGKGAGVLYTATKEDPSNITTQILPEVGWEFDIPHNLVMALCLKKGAIQIFRSNKDYEDGSNTHYVVIAEP